MRRIPVLIVIVFATMWATNAFADVTVTIADTAGFPGDTLKVPIRVSDLTGLEVYSYQFKLHYDSTVVRAIGVDSAGTLTEGWDRTWLNLNHAGEVIAGNYGIQSLENTGVLIYIVFELFNGIDDSTQLEFQQFEFNAGNPAAQTSNGSVKILPPPVTVSFRSNSGDSMRIKIDGIETVLPFDTTWIHGSTHRISAVSPQQTAPDLRFVFKNWSDGGDTSHTVIPVSDTTFTVVMEKQFLLTVNSAHGKTTGSGWYADGATATFSVDSVAAQNDSIRYRFKKWVGTGNSSYTGDQRTVSIVMTDPVVETAQWGIQYFLAVESPHGEPHGSGWYDSGDTVVIGIEPLVTPTAGTRYLFQSWSGQGNGSYTGETRTPAVVVLAPIVEQAVWRTEYYLWVETAPESIATFQQSGWYPENQTVRTDTAAAILRRPDYVYGFQYWSLDGSPLAVNPALVIMDTSHHVIANYQIDSVRVRITTNVGPGTSIYVDGKKSPVPYEQFWAYGFAHLVGIDTLQFSSDLNTRYKFDSWSNGKSQDQVVKADTVISLTAWLRTQHFLSVDTHPSGLIDFGEQGWYDQGDSVNLAAVPEQIIVTQDTFNFRGWHLDNKPVEGNPIGVIMDQPHIAIALYKDLYFITGKITDRSNNPVLNASVVLSGSFQDTVAVTAEGEYYFNFLTQGDYRIVPEAQGFRFEPAYRHYVSLQSSLPHQNFVAIDTLKPVIALIYPRGGEQLRGATNDTIRWEATDNMGIKSLAIDFSIDNGATWQSIANLSPVVENYYDWKIPDVSSSQCRIRLKATDYDGNQAIDQSRSAFSIQGNSAIADQADEQLPTKFEVWQNYPNPFNGATWIRFQLPKSSTVRITIFNTRGQRIVTLANKQFQPGRYQVRWEGTDQSGRMVTSGIYFCQVEASGVVLTKRLLYLR